jgi:hypothetical protein
MNQQVRRCDGTHAVIRPYLPIPREAIAEAYREVSMQSRYHRSHCGPPPHRHHAPSPRGRDRQCEPHCPRQGPRARPGPDSIIGATRIVRYPDEPTSADVAVTVRDQWCGRGAATALLDGRHGVGIHVE